MLKRFFRDSTALFFTLVFPLIFLLVFGGIFGGGQDINFNVGLVNQSQTEFSKQFVTQLEEAPTFSIEVVESVEAGNERLGRGELDVIVELPASFGELDQNNIPNGELIIFNDPADQEATQTFTSVMQAVLSDINSQFVEVNKPLTLRTESIQTTNLSQLDYLIPGLLGFSVLSLGIFGLSNTLPSAKKEGILRRLQATPLTTFQLITGTALFYLVIGLLAIALMLVSAIVLFDFTFMGDLLSLSLFAILSTITMIGFGLAIGGWAKNENQAAPLSNLIAFPLMFLSGVFFPRFLMPEWLQSASALLPLSPIVDGFRKITAEGQTILNLGPELILIFGWLLLIYFVAVKVFRWS